MGTLAKTAALIEEIYYNGNVQYLGGKLQYEDFLLYLSIEAGDSLRLQFYEQLQLDGEVGAFLSSMLEMRLAPVVKMANGMSVVDMEIYSVPRALGVFAVYPVLEGCSNNSKEPDYERKFIKIKTGEEHFYTKKRSQDLGKDFYSMRGVRTSLVTSEKEVFVEAIFGGDENIEKIEFPASVLSAAMKVVLGQILRVPGYVDTTADGDPNQKETKEKLGK